MKMRKFIEMLGFEGIDNDPELKALAEQDVRPMTEAERAESFVIGVDDLTPFDLSAVTREAFLEAFNSDGETWLDALTDDEYDTLYERFSDAQR